MTEKRVLHFVRKSSQLKASFICNQLSNHAEYIPYIIFRKKVTKRNDGGFAQLNLKGFIFLDLSEDETWYEKFLFRTVKVLSGRQVKKIKQFITANKITICHFHYGSDCGVFYPVLRNLLIPSIVSFYGYDCSSFPKRFFGYGEIYLKNRVFKNITKVLAMSPDMKTDLIAAGCPEEKIVVHYYGTDVCRFYLLEKQFTDKDPVMILSLCSLVPQKGHLFLLKSIAKIVAWGVLNFRLRIVGTGVLENELKKFVQNNNLSSYIQFVGAIPYGENEMIREYHNADIFVHPSVVAPDGDKEGIPGTIIEAMSAALPVISTYHAGIPYIIIHNETGMLVNEHDIESLSETLIKMINNPQLRKSIGLAGQYYAVENLDLMKKEIELEDLYQQITCDFKTETKYLDCSLSQ